MVIALLDMSLPASILVFKGTEPYSLFYKLKQIMQSQVNRSMDYNLTPKDYKIMLYDSYDVFKDMHAQGLDDVTADLPNDLRIEIVDSFSCEVDEYEKYTCNIEFRENTWKLEVHRSELPAGLESGHYKCAVRVDAKLGFWKRTYDNGKLMNSLMMVPCKMYLIIKERTGDMVNRPKKYFPLQREFEALCADFCETFQIK